MAGLEALSAASVFNVKGWVTIVTGGGTGLGLMTARALAANGAKVYITGRRVEKLKEAELQDSKSGGSIIGIQMDVTSKDSIKETVQAIKQKEKFVNLLVNNAGVSSKNFGPEGLPQGSPQEISDKLWEAQNFDDFLSIYTVNVASIYFVSIALLPLLCAAKDHGYPEAGNILNISSVSGITKTSQNGQFSYNASKAGTISLTEQLAVELKRPDLEIRVNTIAPGYFPSEMTSVAGSKGKEEFRTKWTVPFGRAGDEKDYAQAVLGLACNQYCSGSTLIVDGGYLLARP